jgi:hypothetical protein
MADEKKIDLLLQYILCAAGQMDWESRELGMIHLLKYVYLADLHYAEHHEGKTFTGKPWKFHHFGPWSEEVYLRIEPALAAICAQKREFYSSNYDKDIFRWSIEDDQLYDRLESQMDISLSGIIQKFVHEFGNDTTGLLHFVYRTPPMLQAAPEEFLVFNPIKKQTIESCIKEESVHLPNATIREKKKRKIKFQELKKRLNSRLERELKESNTSEKPPRYDDIFFEGLRQLDALAGDPIEPMECTVVFTDEVWKSKARFDPDVP